MASTDPPTGYHDDPLSRQVQPPLRVWISLATAYPLPQKPGQFIPKGLDLQATVPGRLHLWVMTTTGHWVGWVTYEAPTMRGVTGWVIAAALEPRYDQPARRDAP